MPHSIFARIESLWQRILPGTTCRKRYVWMDTVLFMRFSASLERMAIEPIEAIRSLRAGLPSRVRLTGRSMHRQSSNANVKLQIARA